MPRGSPDFDAGIPRPSRLDRKAQTPQCSVLRANGCGLLWQGPGSETASSPLVVLAVKLARIVEKVNRGQQGPRELRERCQPWPAGFQITAKTLSSSWPTATKMGRELARPEFRGSEREAHIVLAAALATADSVRADLDARVTPLKSGWVSALLSRFGMISMPARIELVLGWPP
jgi:hypothetical protein